MTRVLRDDEENPRQPKHLPDQASEAALLAMTREVFAAMEAWERADGTGSARPVFEEVWRAARARHGERGTVLDREGVWQTWLQGGPASRARMLAIYERVAPRCSPAFRRVLLELIGQQREPGEDG